MKVLTIGGSNSEKSINRQLANFAASLIPDADITTYDLSRYELPIFSTQREEVDGIPQLAKDFATMIDGTDLLIVSLAEHNGSYCAGFKNLIDWISRIADRKAWGQKPMILMATSPGGRGGATVLAGAKVYFPYMGAELRGTFSLPQFYENFKNGEISNSEKQAELLGLVQSL